MLGILHRAYKLVCHQSQKKISFIGWLKPPITFISTSVCKFYVVKFVVVLEYSLVNSQFPNWHLLVRWVILVNSARRLCQKEGGEVVINQIKVQFLAFVGWVSLDSVTFSHLGQYFQFLVYLRAHKFSAWFWIICFDLRVSVELNASIQHIFLFPYDILSIASIRIIEVYTTGPSNWCLSTWEKEVQLFDWRY